MYNKFSYRMGDLIQPRQPRQPRQPSQPSQPSQSRQPIINSDNKINDHDKLENINKNDNPYKRDSRKNFYVCSYGGSGSTLLYRYLNKFGTAHHIHSKNPPLKLEKVTGEHFNGIQIDESELKNYTVIFIYKNPIKAIFSRYAIVDKNNNFLSYKPPNYLPYKPHLKNVECDRDDISLNDCISENKDLYKLEEFFDKYTTPDKNRNYKILCIKYEDLWQNIEYLNYTLGIPTIKDSFPKKRETVRKNTIPEKLNEIYKPLIQKMEKMKFIEQI